MTCCTRGKELSRSQPLTKILMKHPNKQTRLDSLLTHILLAFVLLLQSAFSDQLLL